MLRFFHERPDTGKTGMMPRYNRTLMISPTTDAAEWIDISWEALMKAMERAGNDNERMLLRERDNPAAIRYCEEEEDQTGLQSAIRRGQVSSGVAATGERKAGTWDEMHTTITVGVDGGECLPTDAVDEGEIEEERKPPNTPMEYDPASMMAVRGEEQEERAIYLDSGSSKHLVPNASMLQDKADEGLDLRGIDGPTKATVMGKRFVGMSGEGQSQQVKMEDAYCIETFG
eukprot:g82654.t1